MRAALAWCLLTVSISISAAELTGIVTEVQDGESLTLGVGVRKVHAQRITPLLCPGRGSGGKARIVGRLQPRCTLGVESRA